MLFSLGGAIFCALKAWVIRVCPDGLGGAARGGDGPVVAPTQGPSLRPHLHQRLPHDVDGIA